MSIPAVLAPVFVQVALTFVLLFWMGRERFASVRAGQVRVKEIALREQNWPVRVQQIANTFHNQFEVPMLFYALVALALLTRQADLVFVLMAWIFVAARLVHAYIYTTSNVVIRRFQAFMAGTTVLMLMWVIFAMRVLFLGAL
jgi:hypothetical protein